MVRLDTSEIPGDSDVPDMAEILILAGLSVIAAIQETGIVAMVESIAAVMDYGLFEVFIQYYVDIYI